MIVVATNYVQHCWCWSDIKYAIVLDFESIVSYIVLFFLADVNPGCSDGDLLLKSVNPDYQTEPQYEGIVSVCLAGEWGAVCHHRHPDNAANEDEDKWGIAESRVACNQLGFVNLGECEKCLCTLNTSS